MANSVSAGLIATDVQGDLPSDELHQPGASKLPNTQLQRLAITR
jgi:hypothetical protein